LKTLKKNEILKNLPKNRLNLDIFSEIDSTNDEAKRIDILKEFHVIIAEKQTLGKGRQGKKWSSPDSGNIYMTICTQNDLSSSPISLITGLACKNAIDEISGRSSIMLKWPNDILLNNKKVGGILVEIESEQKKIRTIVGIGINLNIKKEESWWGDLSEYGLETKRNELINLILSKFIETSNNIEFNWKDKWKNSCIHMNKEITLNDSNSYQKKVIFKDVDEKGNAIIETDSGKEIISSGEISIKGVY
tara:strand:- start:1219 stop:1962 length:744 start_codon:yes stop_codon:yes gene_type:complete